VHGHVLGDAGQEGGDAALDRALAAVAQHAANDDVPNVLPCAGQHEILKMLS
jgi:hypothetical protein